MKASQPISNLEHSQRPRVRWDQVPKTFHTRGLKTAAAICICCTVPAINKTSPVGGSRTHCIKPVCYLEQLHTPDAHTWRPSIVVLCSRGNVEAIAVGLGHKKILVKQTDFQLFIRLTKSSTKKSHSRLNFWRYRYYLHIWVGKGWLGASRCVPVGPGPVAFYYSCSLDGSSICSLLKRG